MSQHATRPGASDETTVDHGAHRPIDRAVPRAGHRFEYGGDESVVRNVRTVAAASAVPEPDHRMLDPVVGVETRAATVPVAFTVRDGFEDRERNYGNRGPLERAQARPAPQQQMEASPTARRNTLRVTPTPWDEALVRGRDSA